MSFLHLRDYLLLFICFLLLLIGATAYAQRLHNEKYYQTKWCKARNGQVEVILEGNVRCDCLLDVYAIEFDFANHWYEAVGQSLYYAMLTGKSPGIVLIVENNKDQIYVDRMVKMIKFYHLPIQTWTTVP